MAPCAIRSAAPPVRGGREPETGTGAAMARKQENSSAPVGLIVAALVAAIALAASTLPGHALSLIGL